jgi:sodium/bile acid cotransporter 7
MAKEYDEVVASSTADTLHQIDEQVSNPPTVGIKSTFNKDEKGNSANRRPSWLKEAIQIVVEQWFLVGLGLLIAIASQVQVPSHQQKLKRTVTAYLCITIIFFK